MNLFDVIIILLLISGVVIGFKRGFFRQLVSFIGVFAVVVISFLFKNQVSIILYENLPFFKFAGVIKGVTVLNIALYELIAFLAVATIVTIIFRMLLKFTNIFESLLKVTIVFAPLTRLGGAIVGFIETFIWSFIILYVMSLPMFSIPNFNESKLKDKILNNTPLLSGFTEQSINVVNEFVALKDKYEVTPDAEQFNKETLDLFLKYDVVTVESIDKLVEKNKLQITNIDEILNKYREV